MKYLIEPRSLLAVAIVRAWQAPRLEAQPPPYPYPYPYGHGGFGPGNVLQGQAQVMDAQGNLMLQQEQALIVREQALQAKLDTKRKTLDELNYEREHTWTYTQDQERIEGLRIMRLLKNPRENEVLSGSAMNTLLPYLTQVAHDGTRGSPVYLNQDELKKVNVTGAGSVSNLGVLGNVGKMTWPLALRGPNQREFDKLLTQTVADAAAGNLDLSTYNKVARGIDQLQSQASELWHKEEIDSGMYLESKRFLESLRGGIAVLRQPDAAKYLAGGYAARGANVGELVTNMAKQGLRFAPALPGSEPAYFGLYSAMVAFAAGGESDTGFRVRLAPPILDAATRKQQ